MTRAKLRPSMIDEFPSKTEDFLDFVGGGNNHPSIGKSINEKNGKVASDSLMLLKAIRLPNRQPRRYFSTQAMDSLVKSIREHGIIQPLLVRPTNDENIFELIAGERRYRAANTLGLSKVPVIIRDLTDQQALQVTLLENLQREDLNPIEETEGILQLLCMNLDASKEEVISLLNQIAHIKKQGGELTNNVIRKQWEQVSEIFSIIGRLTPDSFRSNSLPLLSLPKDILEALREGSLEYTKARAISRLKDQDRRQELLERVIEENWSVRDIQDFINLMKPQNSHDDLVSRIKSTYHKVKQNKRPLEPKQRQILEKLLTRIEKILD
jgi:ParB family transcriptional regulator, chromosome partitioning protein